MIEFLDFEFDAPGRAVSVRVEREAAEDDLGVESLDDEGFRSWFEENQSRIRSAALSKSLARPAYAPGEDWTVVLKGGDLEGF